MPTDPRRVPLDPRTVECPECYLAPFPAGCTCHGTGRVPLHPTPTVEVWEEGSKWCWILEDARLGSGYQTDADAICGARLAWLGARLSSRGCEVIVVVPVGERVWNVLASGPTADAAIEAAFVARDTR